MLSQLTADLRKFSRQDKAVFLPRFFKTGPGQYGEGDRFLGVMVPDSRKIVKKYRDLPFSDSEKLLQSPWHEERLVALLILVNQFQRGSEAIKKQIFDFYLHHTDRINNWDLVDLSASNIVGAYLSDKPRDVLYKLARSKNIWERRIAIISTLYFIVKQKESQDTFKIAEMLLTDSHDLIHKAVGWMLREVGKRISREELEFFLQKHYKTMPRTMLRYAIEHFPQEKRKAYSRSKSL